MLPVQHQQQVLQQQQQHLQQQTQQLRQLQHQLQQQHLFSVTAVMPAFSPETLDLEGTSSTKPGLVSNSSAPESHGATGSPSASAGIKLSAANMVEDEKTEDKTEEKTEEITDEKNEGKMDDK